MSLGVGLALGCAKYVFITANVTLFFTAVVDKASTRATGTVTGIVLPVIFVTSLMVKCFLMERILGQATSLTRSTTRVYEAGSFSERLRLRRSSTRFRELRLALGRLLRSIHRRKRFTRGIMRRV